MIKLFLKSKALSVCLLSTLSSAWSVGNINICLQHDDKEGFVKLPVQISSITDGRDITTSDGFPAAFTDKYTIALTDNKDNPKIQIISDQKGVRDDNGDFLNYDTIVFQNETELTIIPILYNKQDVDLSSPSSRSKKTQSKTIKRSFQIFPNDKRHKEVELYFQEGNSEWDWQLVGDYYYNIPEKKIFLKGNAQEGNQNTRLSSQNKFHQPKVNSTFIRDMPFSNEVSVLGTVWSVFDMYEKDLIALGNRGKEALNLLKNRPITRVFPRMNEEQYNELGFPQEFNDTYNDNYDNAFHYSKDKIHYLCFFPIEEDSKQFSSRSLPTVAHETGHNVLQIIRPDISNRFIGKKQDIYSRAFDESFGDCTALFFLLQFEEMREKVFTATQGNLSMSSFLSKIANRDASKPIKSLTCACEEHDLSEPLTKIIYNILRASLRERVLAKPFSDSIAEVSRDLRFIYLGSVLEYEYDGADSAFNFADFARIMVRQALTHEMNISYLAPLIEKVCQQNSIDLQDMKWQFPACTEKNDPPRPGPSLCKSLKIRKNILEQANISYNQGNWAYDEKYYSQALILFKQAAYLGLADAQNNLGCMYETGQGLLRPNYNEAYKWYQKAAAQGHPQARENFRHLRNYY